MPQDNMSHRIELSDKATNLFISLKGAYSKSNGGKGQAAAKAVAQAATQAAAQALAKAGFGLGFSHRNQPRKSDIF